MGIGSELWPFGLQMAGFVTAICRVRIEIRLGFVVKIILKVRFRNVFEFQFIFGDLRALEFERFNGVFPTFSSYTFFALFFFSQRQKPTQYTHNDGKIQQLKDIEVSHNTYFILKTFRRQTYNPIHLLYKCNMLASQI